MLMSPSLESGDRFCELVGELRQVAVRRDEAQAQLLAEVQDAILARTWIELGARAARRFKSKTRPEVAPGFEAYGKVCVWARDRMKVDPRCWLDVELEAIVRHRALGDRAATLQGRLRAQLEELWPYAVFRRSSRCVEVSYHDVSRYSTQGYGAAAYARFDAALDEARLARRGFRVQVLPVTKAERWESLGLVWKNRSGFGGNRGSYGTDLHGYSVVADVDQLEGVRAALKLWPLDERSMLGLAESCGQINFYARSPYLQVGRETHCRENPAGPWDVPKAQREGPDAPWYARALLNERAHLSTIGAAE